MMNPNLFLRRILALDAASCAAMGVPMTLAAAPLAPLFGLDRALIFAAGLVLLPLAAFIFWLAARSSPLRPLVWLVILGNLAWTFESFWLIAQESGRITPLGSSFVAAQALAVLAVAGLEYAGLRRIRTIGTD